MGSLQLAVEPFAHCECGLRNLQLDLTCSYFCSRLPTCLSQAGYIAAHGSFPQLVSTKTKFSINTVRAASNATPALLPSDAFAAAKAMELACHIKLDIELVARRCLPELLFKKPVSEETKDQVRKDLARGMGAVSRLAVCDPYVAGSEFSIADLYLFYGFSLAGTLAKMVVGVDLLKDQEPLSDLIGRLAERPSIARVTAEAAA